MLLKRISAFLELMRPLEWSKTFGNIILGVIAAAFYFQPNFSFELISKILLACISAGICLWSGLYVLNDYTDWKKDLEHEVKRKRPIPSGRVKPNEALIFSIALIILAFVIGSFLSTLFLLCLLAMLINQLLYTTKPIKLKEKPIADLISGSLINPIFRFSCGWVLIANNFNIPLLFLLFILGLQFGGFTLYRLSSKSLEKKLAYNSSVVLLSPKFLKTISYFAIFISLLSYVLLCFADIYKPLQYFGYLPFCYLYYGLLMLLPLPLYKNALLNPEKINIKRMYFVLYIHYILFILGLILLMFVFKIR